MISLEWLLLGTSCFFKNLTQNAEGMRINLKLDIFVKELHYLSSVKAIFLLKMCLLFMKSIYFTWINSI